MAFERSPELEFEHYLATQLAMTVGELRARMGQAEFVRWRIYYARQAQRDEMDRLRGRAL